METFLINLKLKPTSQEIEKMNLTEISELKKRVIENAESAVDKFRAKNYRGIDFFSLFKFEKLGVEPTKGTE